MRVVLDTNVLISGLLWSGAPARIVDAFLAGQFELCLSEPLFSELEKVLSRPRLRGQVSFRGIEVRDTLRHLRSLAHVANPTPILAPSTLRDSDDRIVLECAYAAKADWIVSGDKDLLSIGNFGEIAILSVNEALKELGL